MNILMTIRLTIVQLAKRVWIFPQAFARVLTQKRKTSVLNENEVERLDRLRNPSKYQGTMTFQQLSALRVVHPSGPLESEHLPHPLFDRRTPYITTEHQSSILIHYED